MTTKTTIICLQEELRAFIPSSYENFHSEYDELAAIERDEKIPFKDKFIRRSYKWDGKMSTAIFEKIEHETN